MTARRISLSQGTRTTPYWLSVQSDQPGNRIHTTSKNRLSRLCLHIVVQTHTYMHTCTHTYINLHITTIRKKVIKLRGDMGGAQGRKNSRERLDEGKWGMGE